MPEPLTFLDGRVTLHVGDCREVLRALPDACIDSVVTDPPYALVSIGKRFGKEGAAGAKDYTGEKAGATGAYARASRGFMGKTWDTGETAFAAGFWREVYRVLKPGGWVLSFSGTRTYHRMACAIEDAGFEIRDMIDWLYGSGFPKSLDVSKAIDKAAGIWRGRAGPIKSETVGQVAKGTEYERTQKGDPATDEARQWQGWGTALKPAKEPIAMARKPLSESSVARNVLKYGTGALNIDGCRVESAGADPGAAACAAMADAAGKVGTGFPESCIAEQEKGRWPANVVHDGSDEVVTHFPDEAGGGQGGQRVTYGIGGNGTALHGGGKGALVDTYADSGSAARFFYHAKADARDRAGSKHPTVKPIRLMQWLCRLVTPPGGTVLDPFAGTGTTGEAAWREGFNAVLIEREAEYVADIERRMKTADSPMAREAVSLRKTRAGTDGDLFAMAGLAGAGRDSISGDAGKDSVFAHGSFAALNASAGAPCPGDARSRLPAQAVTPSPEPGPENDVTGNSGQADAARGTAAGTDAASPRTSGIARQVSKQ